MSAFERRVRTRKTSAGTSGDVQFEATAQAIAASNTEDELVERAAYAFRAWEIKQQTARELAFEQVVRRRSEVASAARALGAPADAHGNVSRLDAKRAIKGAQRRAPDVPAKPREAPSEPRSAPSGIVVPTVGELLASERAADFEQDHVRRP